MDNNEIYNEQPGRPFTERTEPTEGVQPDEAEPEQNNDSVAPVSEQFSATDSSSAQAAQPVSVHTGQYCSEQNINGCYAPQSGNNEYIPQNVNGNYPTQNMNGCYAPQNGSYGCAPQSVNNNYPPQQNVNGSYVPQGTPAAGCYGAPPTGNFYGQNYGAGQPYSGGFSQPVQDFSSQAQSIPKPEKKKVSAGLVAVVISMFALIIVGFVGMTVYLSAVVSPESGKTYSNKYDDIFDYYDRYFDDEDSDSYGFTVPNDSSSPDVDSNAHPESDYSDKTDKSFKGITLGDVPKDSDNDDKYNTQSATSKASKSVVGIVCYKGDSEDSVPSSQGSGIIITKDGYIATNSHVIGDSRTAYKIKVVTSDKKSYTAGVVGFDTRSDLAVLKLENPPKDLEPAEFGSSDRLELGEEIIAIGNPGGIDYQNSITRGVVSAFDREPVSNSLVDFIQVDAAINPGNSGGPIVNRYGQVVGISTAKIASTSYEGMGFAIPSVTAKDIIDSLIKNSYVSGRVKIGIMGKAVGSTGYENSSDVKGIKVSDIVEGGPCDNTELRENDIITKLGDTKIENFRDIYKALEEYKPNDKVKLTFYRPSDGSTKEIEITLQEDK